MFNKLYVFLLLGAVALSGCQRQQIGGFQASHHEPVARAQTAPVVPTEAGIPAPVPTAFFLSPDVVPAQPAPVASVSDQLVASAKGTRHEARANRLKAAIDRANAAPQLNSAPRQLNFAEKAVVKAVTKKLNRQVAKAKRGEATQRLDSNIGLGILLLAVALILALLAVGNVYVVIAAVLGVAFLLIGLLNQAAR